MELISKLCCYSAGSGEYFGKIHIKYMILVAFLIMAVTQFFITIWYLTFQVWWWFIALFSCIAALSLLGFGIWKRKILFLKIVLVYQALFSLLFFAASIWLLVLLCRPYSYSYIFVHCFNEFKHSVSYCVDQVRITTAVYFPIYFLAGILNLYCLLVLYNFMVFITRPTLPAYNPQLSPATSRPAGTSKQYSPEAHDDYLPTE